MPTKVIYLGEQPGPQPGTPVVMPPLAPGDTGWPTSPLLQPTQPVPTQPVQHVTHGYPAPTVQHVLHGYPAPQITYPPVTQPHSAYQPPMMVYAPPPQRGSSLFGSALLWCILLLVIGMSVCVIVLRVAPDRATQLTAKLQRPAINTLAGANVVPNTSLPTAQNGAVQVKIIDLTTDRLVVAVVNISAQPLAFAGDAVRLRADNVDYFMPSGTPTVQMQPGDEHQIVISPVPAGASLDLAIQLPGADALEVKVR